MQTNMTKRLFSKTRRTKAMVIVIGAGLAVLAMVRGTMPNPPPVFPPPTLPSSSILRLNPVRKARQ